MAVKFMDGMRVVVPDVPRDIEDAVYEDANGDTNVLECFSQEEYQAALENYNGAKLIADLLPQNDGYLEVQRRLDLVAQEACSAQISYMGTSQHKKNLLDLKRQLAVNAASSLRTLVEDAALVLRPVLVEGL